MSHQYSAFPECDGEEMDSFPAAKDTGGVPRQKGITSQVF